MVSSISSSITAKYTKKPYLDSVFDGNAGESIELGDTMLDIASAVGEGAIQGDGRSRRRGRRRGGRGDTQDSRSR